MGRKPTPSEEVQLLRQATREAHEAAKDLRDAIRAANALAPALVDDFQATHERELNQLANHLQTEMNHQSATLNEAVDRARTAIVDQLRASELEYDKTSGRIKIIFGAGRFDTTCPLPYPEHQPKGSTP
jgi:hypothetical protein